MATSLKSCLPMNGIVNKEDTTSIKGLSTNYSDISGKIILNNRKISKISTSYHHTTVAYPPNKQIKFSTMTELSRDRRKMVAISVQPRGFTVRYTP